MLRFVITCLNLDCLVFERLFDKDGLFAFACIFPAADIHVLIVAALSFAVGSLVFFAEVSAARFVAVERVDGHEASDCEEVFEAERFFKFHIESVGFSRDEQVCIKFFFQSVDLVDGLDQSFCRAAHADEVPHDQSQFFVD